MVEDCAAERRMIESRMPQRRQRVEEEETAARSRLWLDESTIP